MRAPYMAPDLHKSLMAFAYTLIFVAVLPSLASYDSFSWAVVPVWIAVVGYSSSILKNLSDGDSAKRFEKVVWLAWITYYSLCLVWPFPLHWYDSLIVATLFLESGALSNALLTTFYLFSAAKYMEHGDALQVSGRMLLVVLLATTVLLPKKNDIKDG